MGFGRGSPHRYDAPAVITDLLADAIRLALESLGVDAPAEIGLERPAHQQHGDWSTNVALVVAKPAGRNPRELGQQLADALVAAEVAHVDRIEIAGPGFVNFHLRPTWLHDLLRATVVAGDNFGRSDSGGGRAVMIEFVSANPTGPLHAGHARGAVYGDSLARLLGAVGYEVSREFYINDRGSQMAKMGTSIAAVAAGGKPPEDGYHGVYIAEWAAELPAGADPVEFGYARALADQRETLGRLGVEFDVWFSERDMVARGEIETTLADLRDHGVVEDNDGAVWLRSTDFGDDKDRVLVKSDGSYTYLLPDIAYHRDKYRRGFDLLINVWGADHHGYITRMKAAMSALGHRPDQLEVEITQMVRLMREGDEVKLSKRTGDIIELRDIIDEVGADATRFTYLLQSLDSPQTVDLDLIVSKTMDNPVFYVQMAHARLCSVDRVAAERGFVRPPLESVDLSPLTHEREAEILRLLGDYPVQVELAARDRAPHKLTTWVRELAAATHGWYHDCPILRDDVPTELRDARWWLADAARIGLLAGLTTLGVAAPSEM